MASFNDNIRNMDTNDLVTLHNETKEKRLNTGGHKRYDRLLEQEKLIEEEIGRRTSEDDEGMEDFPAYLGRVGADYRESGSEATAEDYEEAAKRLRAATRAVRDLPTVPNDEDIERVCAILCDRAIDL